MRIKVKSSSSSHPLRYLSLLFVSFLCFIAALYFKDSKEGEIPSFGSARDFTDTNGTTIGKRKSGVLWYNKESENYLITFGKAHGIKKGDTFNVYDAEEIIGKVKISTPLKTISIVEISNLENKKLKKRYYTVSRE